VFAVPPATAGETVPIGRPLPGAATYVLDDGLVAAPIGVAGEVYVGGDGVARGYVNRPRLTAERFLPDPFGPPGSRMYRTGDLARVLPDGDIDLIGRRDDEVKVNGFRVDLGFVESVLKEHSTVRDAAVVADTDPSGPTRLAAYYMSAESPDSGSPHRAQAEALAAHCAARLPAYLTPDTFTSIDSIPLSYNGKLDRGALPRVDRAADRAAVDDAVAPRNLAEARIAEIFTELLGARSGAHSHFFQAGGNSILALRLIAAIQSAFDIELPIRTVFEGPTVAEIATAVELIVRAEIAAMSDAELMADSLPMKERSQ
jgi:acyl carrier protein